MLLWELLHLKLNCSHSWFFIQVGRIAWTKISNWRFDLQVLFNPLDILTFHWLKPFVFSERISNERYASTSMYCRSIGSFGCVGLSFERVGLVQRHQTFSVIRSRLNHVHSHFTRHLDLIISFCFFRLYIVLFNRHSINPQSTIWIIYGSIPKAPITWNYVSWCIVMWCDHRWLINSASA